LRVEIVLNFQHYGDVSKVEHVEAELRKLSPSELPEVRGWLNDFVEDGMEFTPEFESVVRESERELKSGVLPRTRKP
jgi:hypothetical protein